MSNEAPGSNRPPLSRFNASILLYLIATIVIGLLVGTVLNGLNRLPPYVATIAGSLGAVIALLSGLLGTLLERSFPKGIWRNANRPVAIVASILTVGFLTLSTLVITSPPRCPSVGPCPQETATAPAQANDATATVQAYLTATAIAQAMQKYNRAAAAGIMYGFDAHHTRTNPYEIILSADNVAGLIQAWTAPTGDSITSSPAVANGMVYVGSGDGKLYAFDAATGVQKWTSSAGIDTGDTIYFSSPAVANGVVYVGSTDGKLYAFHLS